MDLVELLGLCVVRFQVAVADGPSRRNTAVMSNLAKILLTQTEQSSTVELCVAAHIVVCVGMQVATLNVAPDFLRVVSGVDIDGLRIPIVFLASDIIAAFENQNPLSRWSQVVGQRPSTRSRPDDDQVVLIVVTHNHLLHPSVSYRLTAAIG